MLFTVSAYQFGSYKRNGRYAASREELDPGGHLLKGREVELRTSEDRQEFWAWAVTPTGFMFGIAGRAGDHPIWQYQGEEPPAGGIDSAADWRHVATDYAPSEW